MDDVSTFKIKQFLFSLAFLVCVYIIFRLFFFNEQVVTIDIYNTKTNMENFKEQLIYTIEDEEGNILDEHLSSEQNLQLQPLIPIGKIGTYYVKQQAGTTPHVVYDESVYKIEIDTGWLFSTADLKFYKDNILVEEIVFNNVYNEEYEIAVIECEAILTTEGINDSEFGLIDDKNEIIAKSKVDEDGKVIFKVPFNEEGEFEYKLRDVTNKEGHIKDGHDFRVIVSCEILSRRLKITSTFYEGEREIPKVVFGSGYNWEEKTIEIPMFNATNETILAETLFGTRQEITPGNYLFTYTTETPIELCFKFNTKSHTYELYINFINHNNNIMTTEYYLIKDDILCDGDIVID